MQYKIIQGNKRQYNTTQYNIRQDMASHKQDNTTTYDTIQDTAKHGKTNQHNTMQYKTREDNNI